MEFFRVVNFEHLQHYKDRSPPWIKLYNDLLDDYNFACLQDASKLHLLLIFLLASRSENKIPCDPKWISSRISASETIDLDSLFASGFIEKIPGKTKPEKPKKGASTPLAGSKQDACLEREGEREGEEENKTYRGFDFSAWPEMPSTQTLDDWFAMRKRIKADVSQTVVNQFAKEMALAYEDGRSVDDCLGWCVTKSWQGFKFQWLKNEEARNAQGDGSAPRGRPSGNRAESAKQAALDAAFGPAESGFLEADFERLDGHEADPGERGGLQDLERWIGGPH